VAAARLPAVVADLAAAALNRQRPLQALSLVAAAKDGEATARPARSVSACACPPAR
jgi:hypothetical protein